MFELKMRNEDCSNLAALRQQQADEESAVWKGLLKVLLERPAAPNKLQSCSLVGEFQRDGKRDCSYRCPGPATVISIDLTERCPQFLVP